MKIVEVKRLAFPEIEVIRFARFRDHRGYFTEHYRNSDFDGDEQLESLRGIKFLQMNESFSRAGTIRGLHFQWSPYQGKLVRAVNGRLIDLVLDIRKGSPTFGKIIAHDLPAHADADHAEWIWVSPGFAHGMLLTEDTLVEYFCSSEYNPKCEAGISLFSHDIDWSLCQPELKAAFDEVATTTDRVSPKDRDAPCVSEWARDPRSANFLYTQGLSDHNHLFDTSMMRVA
jgi:dTDP-4-dehydrorhamnose 3,5-epimerase